jgi:hypothetical protein
LDLKLSQPLDVGVVVEKPKQDIHSLRHIQVSIMNVMKRDFKSRFTVKCRIFLFVGIDAEIPVE